MERTAMTAEQAVLIELVRQRPILYKRHPDGFQGSSRMLKRKCWQDIAVALSEAVGREITAEEVSKKWTTLRDTFMYTARNYAARCASLGESQVSKPLWKCWKAMQWYMPYTTRFRNDNKAQGTRPRTHADESEMELMMDDSVSDGDGSPPGEAPVVVVLQSAVTSSLSTPHTDTSQLVQSPTMVSTPVTSYCPPSTTNDAARGEGDHRPIATTATIRVADTVRAIHAVNSKRQHLPAAEDEEYHYGQSVAAKLRCLTDYQRAVARRSIEDALFNAQFGTRLHAQNVSLSNGASTRACALSSRRGQLDTSTSSGYCDDNSSLP